MSLSPSSNECPRSERPAQIERMRRLAGAGDAQRMNLDARIAQEVKHVCRAPAMRAVISPRADDNAGLARRGEDGAVVAAADRLARRLHLVRVGGAPAEEIRDDQRAVAPALGIETRAGA